MNGTKLALGTVAAMVIAGAVRRRGSRGRVIPSKPTVPPELERTVQRVVHPAVHTADEGDHLWGYGAAGEPQPDGTLLTWHSTDDPSKLRAVLRQGKPLMPSRQATHQQSLGHGHYSELGGGLYACGTPGYWRRSVDQWEALRGLTGKQLGRLTKALRADLDALPSSYLSSSEREMAQRSIDRVASGEADTLSLSFLAGQPWNMRFVRPAWLKKVGIEPGKQPSTVPVKLTGWFAMLTRNIDHREALALRDAGFAGAFTPSGFSTTPQLAVYDPEAVVQFGTWKRGAAKQAPPGDWIGVTDLGYRQRRRLEGSLAAREYVPTPFDRAWAWRMAQSGYRPSRQHIPGGLASGESGPWPADQLVAGILVELEHTAGPGVDSMMALERAREIATDHLVEDRRYYTKLARMQSGDCD